MLESAKDVTLKDGAASHVAYRTYGNGTLPYDLND